MDDTKTTASETDEKLKIAMDEQLREFIEKSLAENEKNEKAAQTFNPYLEELPNSIQAINKRMLQYKLDADNSDAWDDEMQKAWADVEKYCTMAYRKRANHPKIECKQEMKNNAGNSHKLLQLVKEWQVVDGLFKNLFEKANQCELHDDSQIESMNDLLNCGPGLSYFIKKIQPYATELLKSIEPLLKYMLPEITSDVKLNIITALQTLGSDAFSKLEDERAEIFFTLSQLVPLIDKINKGFNYPELQKFEPTKNDDDDDWTFLPHL